jgi:chemotaxis protein MotB
MPFKCISRAEFDKYRRFERLNAEQAAMISALTNERERQSGEIGFLKTQLKSKEELLAERQRLMAELERRMANVNAQMPAGSEGIEVFQSPEGAGLRVGSDVLFDPGKATLKATGEKVLKEVVDMVAGGTNKVAVCGFTDSDPIKRSGWESNFELSGARALAVLNFLKDQGIPPERMHFRAYGQYSLRYGATGGEDKAKSRRAEILLLNSELMPAPMSAPMSAPKPAVVPK